MLLLESWEVMLVEETRYEARCLGPIVRGYEECCILLHLLHLVDVLLEVRVPDDSSVLQKRTDGCYVGISFAGCGATLEIPTKKSQLSL